VRFALACGLVFALVAGAIALAGERGYNAHAYVIRLPLDVGGERGLALARSEPVLRLALEEAGERGLSPGWLRDHSNVEVTSRMDLAFSVTAPTADRAAALATGYAKAFRRSIPAEPGMSGIGRGARDAEPELGPFGWALLAGTIGAWVGAALSIIRNGMARSRARTDVAAEAPAKAAAGG
jgi:hypothetical protein